jgi:flagellar protein FlaC
LGKDETVPSIDTSTSSSEQKLPEKVISEKKTEEPGKKPEPDRKIIKFASSENSSNQNKADLDLKKKTPDATKADEGKPGKVPDVNKIIGEKTPGASVDNAREELEQRRTILQNLKDFDFQIKKNQEDISNISEKVESLSKDLDDLVSLYEIVSEQMNPFVGLSKVTKKRLDALENITKELDTIKGRMGDIELSLEPGNSTIEAAKKNGFIMTARTPDNNTTPKTTTPEITAAPNFTSIEKSASPTETGLHQAFDTNLSEKEVDEILSKSLENLFIEQNINSMINEFFLSLK